MKFHHLSMTAFGPFAEPVDIDFDQLNEAGLFLIHGATGAGKSSLVDAISFALFGDLPGARRKIRVRSDHAPIEILPEVHLEFSVRTQRIRITRSPKFERPKKRGTGIATQQPKVLLEEYRDGAWVTVTTSVPEAADQITDLLGMGLNQFERVALLPQGEFAAFLRAAADQRRELLERLFDVSTYTFAEQWLADERRSSASLLQEVRAELAGHLSQVRTVLATADLADDVFDAASLENLEELSAQQTVELLVGVGAHLRQAENEALEERDAAERARAHAEQALTVGRECAKFQAKGLAAQQRLAELATEQTAIDELRTGLDQARQADTVNGAARSAERARVDLSESQASLQIAQQQWDQKLPQVDLEEALPAAAGMQESGAQLAQAARAGRQWTRLTDEHLDAQQALVSHAEKVKAATEAATELAQTYALAQKEAAKLSSTDADIDALARREADLIALQKTHQRCTLAQEQVEQAQAALLERREQALTAKEKVLHLRQTRLDGMAAELATQLREGQPCVVCGSAEHPAPADGDVNVTAADIAKAEELQSEAESALAAAQRAHAARAAELSLITDTLEGQPEATQVQKDLVTIKEELATARTALASLRQAEERVEQLAGQSEKAAKNVVAAQEQQARLESREEHLATELDLVASEVRESAAGHAGCPCLPEDANDQTLPTVPVHTWPLPELLAELPALIKSHQAVLNLLTVIPGLRAQTASAGARSEAAEAELDLALEQAGFTSVEQAREATWTAATKDSATAKITAHENAKTAAETTLADTDVLASLAAPTPEIEVLAETASQAKRAEQAARDAWGNARHARVGVTEAETRIREVTTRVSAAAERAERVKAMADLTSGNSDQNTKRMRLSTYVLAARLERIVELANERLSLMGAGRYELRHDDSRPQGRVRGGLGLHVFDLWTGSTRSTESLSGGESFFASLALALGLADAIREEHGGIDLGTLFVDEGFGTLDPESLEEVMEVLEHLQDGGRCVGVISHVPEMRSRIAAHIAVEKTIHGSHARTVVHSDPLCA